MLYQLDCLSYDILVSAIQENVPQFIEPIYFKRGGSKVLETGQVGVEKYLLVGLVDIEQNLPENEKLVGCHVDIVHNLCILDGRVEDLFEQLGILYGLVDGVRGDLEDALGGTLQQPRVENTVSQVDIILRIEQIPHFRKLLNQELELNCEEFKHIQ